MNKKAQIGIYLVIGVVIILGVVVASIFLMRQAPEEGVIEEITELPTYVQPVRAFTDKCLETALDEALFILGHQGGYILFSPDDIIESGYGNQAVLIDGNQSLLPSLTDMEIETAIYVDLALKRCLNDYQTFKDQGYIIKSGQPLSVVEFLDNEVVVFTNMDVKITKGVSTAEFNTYTASSDIRAKHMYDIVEQAIESSIRLEGTDVDLMESFDVDVSTAPFSENAFFYFFSDKRPNKKTFDFVFAKRILI